MNSRRCSAKVSLEAEEVEIVILSLIKELEHNITNWNREKSGKILELLQKILGKKEEDKT